MNTYSIVYVGNEACGRRFVGSAVLDGAFRHLLALVADRSTGRELDLSPFTDGCDRGVWPRLIAYIQFFLQVEQEKDRIFPAPVKIVKALFKNQADTIMTARSIVLFAHIRFSVNFRRKKALVITLILKRITVMRARPC